jgi:HK97 family phage portal protein
MPKPTIMQRFARGLIKRAAKYAGIPLRDPALVAMLGNVPTAAGMDVDEATALNCSAVWQAVTLLSSSVASLPVEVKTLDADGEDKDEAIDTNHPVYHLLNRQPNPYMTPFTFHETLEAHCLTWGNGYAYIEKEGKTPVALWPLMPNQVTPTRREGTGDIYYEFRAIYAGEKDQQYEVDEVIHVPGLGFDGLKGYPVIQMARESIGLTQAAERFGASFFGRGSLPGGVIEHPGDLKDVARHNLRESWEEMHRGPDNAHRIAILDEGMSFKPIGIPPDDAQFLQTRQFQILEVARWFNVPPHMLRDLINATFSNIEHQGIDFLVYSLRPWLLRFQQEYRRKLFTKSEQSRYYVDHDTHKLLMTDVATRFKAYRDGREGGWLTLNNILRREGMPLLPPEIGDIRLQPLNMTVAGIGNAVDPNVIVAVMDVIERMKPVKENLARAILEASLARTDDKLVQGLLEKMKKGGIIK